MPLALRSFVPRGSTALSRSLSLHRCPNPFCCADGAGGMSARDVISLFVVTFITWTLQRLWALTPLSHFSPHPYRNMTQYDIVASLSERIFKLVKECVETNDKQPFFILIISSAFPPRSSESGCANSQELPSFIPSIVISRFLRISPY